MVDITPERRFKNMNLTKTDCGELEFQLGFYTRLQCKVMGTNSFTTDVVLSDGDCVICVLVLKNMTSGLEIMDFVNVHGRTNELPMKKIQRAIETFNALWVI